MGRGEGQTAYLPDMQLCTLYSRLSQSRSLGFLVWCGRTRHEARSASLVNKALLFVEVLPPIAPCSGTSALSAFVKRFTPTELCKLFARLPFGPEKLALTWKIFFVSVSLRSEQFRQIVPKSLSRGNTSPRRSSRLWHVFVFCFPENNFLRNAGLSISLPHWRQVFSGTATRIKVLVGIFSSSIPLPNHWSISRGAKSILTVWQAALHAASWEVRAKMTSLDVIRCKGNKSSFRLLALRARSLALRASRSQSHYALKSSTCEQVYLYSCLPPLFLCFFFNCKILSTIPF